MTEKDWAEFFKLLDAAGQQPSVINDAHSKVIPAADTLPASPNRDTILWETNRAEQANAKTGKALEALETWGKQHQDDGNGGTNPPDDPGPPVGSEAPFGSGKNLHQGVIYTHAGSGKSKCSWAISSGGYPCFASFDKANMGAGHTGGTPWIESPAGSWTYYMVYAADPGRVQDGTLNVVPV